MCVYYRYENPQGHPTHALQLPSGRKGSISVSDSIFNSGNKKNTKLLFTSETELRCMTFI